MSKIKIAKDFSAAQKQYDQNLKYDQKLVKLLTKLDELLLRDEEPNIGPEHIENTRRKAAEGRRKLQAQREALEEKFEDLNKPKTTFPTETKMNKAKKEPKVEINDSGIDNICAQPTSPPLADEPSPLDETSPPPLADEPSPLDETSPPPLADEPLLDVTSPPPLADEPLLDETSPPPLADEPSLDETSPPPLADEPSPLDETSPPPLADEPSPLDETSPPPLADEPSPLDETSPPSLADEPLLDETSPPSLADEPSPLAETSPPPLTDEPLPLAEQTVIVIDNKKKKWTFFRRIGSLFSCCFRKQQLEHA